MKEIKFRAWEPNWKKMFYSDHGDITRCGEGFEWYPVAIPMDDGRGESSEVPRDMILMQFTGLRDKNGKEIYEGDIVRNGKGGTYLVVWGTDIAINDPEYCGWVLRSGGEIPANELFEWGKGKHEVIGNIHETPELLK